MTDHKKKKSNGPNGQQVSPFSHKISLFSPLTPHADTAFKQQRLKAWQPILTPKAVLPTIFIIGLLFAPIGALIIWGSGRVTSITLDYTQCDANAPTDGSFQAMPSGAYSCVYQLARYQSQFPKLYAFCLLTNKSDLLSASSPVSASSVSAPRWTFSNDSSRPVGERAQCEIQFEVPYNLGPGVFLYYKLTN